MGIAFRQAFCGLNAGLTSSVIVGASYDTDAVIKPTPARRAVGRPGPKLVADLSEGWVRDWRQTCPKAGYETGGRPVRRPGPKLVADLSEGWVRDWRQICPKAKGKTRTLTGG